MPSLHLPTRGGELAPYTETFAGNVPRRRGPTRRRATPPSTTVPARAGKLPASLGSSRTEEARSGRSPG